MKKLLALAILSTVFLAKPCFGVDWLRSRIFSSLSYRTAGFGLVFDIGYHYTDSIKFSIEPINNEPYKLGPWIGARTGIGTGLVAKFQYHHKFTSTGITPYITVGTGVIITTIVYEDNYSDLFVPYQIGVGINLPLSSRTSVFAGYKVQKFLEFSRGIEFGISFNL